MTIWHAQQPDGRFIVLWADRGDQAIGKALKEWPEVRHRALIAVRHAKAEDIDEAERLGLSVPDNARKRLFKVREWRREVSLSAIQKRMITQPLDDRGGVPLYREDYEKAVGYMVDEGLGTVRDGRLYLSDIGLAVRGIVEKQPQPFKGDGRKPKRGR